MARGEGEAAPLPGFSPDSLAVCRRALAELDPELLPIEPASRADVVAELARASELLPAELPAARAALETALLALWSNAAGVPAWALLTSDAGPKARRVCALISEEPEHWLGRARAARARGMSACKLKVGRPGAVERELAALAELRLELGPSFTLRLDANRAWSIDEARAYLPRFASFSPELIEEPCAEWPALASPIPLALDETVSALGVANARALRLAGASALILKPTLLGGISACFAWTAVAREHGLDVILSHAFEGPHGLALSATLALAFGSEERAHGLDLDGARLPPHALPYVARGEIRAWREPGFGVLEAVQ